MSRSPAVLVAATSLAEWARERRRTWSDEPLPAHVPPPRIADILEIEAAPTVEVPAFEAPTLEVPAFEVPAFESFAFEEATPDMVVPVAEDIARPSALDAVLAGLQAGTTTAGAMAIAAIARLQSLAEPAAEWLMRGAAVVSILSVVMVVGVNRGQLFAHWDRVAAMVIAATNRPEAAAPSTPSGTGRLSVVSVNGSAQVFVDGTLRGLAPLVLDIPAGAHRVLLTSEKGSVERVVRVQAGEPSEVNEAIFPGWVALATPIDVSLSEDGHLLKRDERGWAILPPGPHDIHIDNRALGVHDVRRVVVTPGDTTRLSFAPIASMLSLTTNELAEVWIDGASFGQAPLVDQPIALGVHDVRVRSAAHERWLRVRATVQPVTVNVDLTRP